MLSLYTRASTSDLNLSLLLKLMGKMPIEFFSNQAYSDTEGQHHAQVFIQRMTPKRVVESLIGGYLNDLF
jgi:hypothetical protein